MVLFFNLFSPFYPWAWLSLTPALSSQRSQALFREPRRRCSMPQSTHGPAWFREPCIHAE